MYIRLCFLCCDNNNNDTNNVDCEIMLCVIEERTIEKRKEGYQEE
jgi:hypothetical protein